MTYPPASASDVVDGRVPVACDHPSGSTFGFGTTTVNCTASDSARNTGRGAFRVTVQDKTPPHVTVPPPITAEATSPSGAAVFYPPASASDTVDGAVAVKCDHPSGSTFALGTTTVTCTAKDAHANTGTGTFKVIVQDTTPPTIDSVVPSSGSVYGTGESGCQPSTVAITAKVSDIYGVGRVVVDRWYVSANGVLTSRWFENGTSLGKDGYTTSDINVYSEIDQSWPHIGSSSGRMEYRVIALDKAGNRTQSGPGSVQVRDCGPY